MACQSYFDELLKYILRLLANFAGNLSATFYLALVASKQGTPNNNQRQNDNKIR
jgi:hypothetical protein